MKRFSILIAALCLCLTGCGKQTTEAAAQIFAMDTVMEVAAYGEHAEQAVKYTEKRIKELENRLSRTKADSLVSGLNRDGSIRKRDLQGNVLSYRRRKTGLTITGISSPVRRSIGTPQTARLILPSPPSWTRGASPAISSAFRSSPN